MKKIDRIKINLAYLNCICGTCHKLIKSREYTVNFISPSNLIKGMEEIKKSVAKYHIKCVPEEFKTDEFNNKVFVLYLAK